MIVITFNMLYLLSILQKRVLTYHKMQKTRDNESIMYTNYRKKNVKVPHYETQNVQNIKVLYLKSSCKV